MSVPKGAVALGHLNQVGLVSVCAKFQLPTKSKNLLSDDLAVGGGGWR